MSFKPITVSQLGAYVKQIFDAEELLHGICVVGEISTWSNVRGTAYFTLKDENSAMSCVCFSASEYQDFKNGDSVMVVGSVRYYTKTGKLNFNASKIEHYGENILYQKFLELKNKLEQKGYFEASTKKTIPQNIKRIGVVSSEGGAVIQDIINVRTRRNPNIDIVLFPAKVQGNMAEYEIARGIEVLDGYDVDVIVVARGGGSMEDLQPFNTEIVADAVHNAKKVVVSAVGHETDFTICDFCADLRVPTPSAAAEVLCLDLMAQKKEIKKQTKKLLNVYDCLFEKTKTLIAEKFCVLSKEYSYFYENTKLLFLHSAKLLYSSFKSYFDCKKALLEHKTKTINGLDPKQILKLGYASIKNNGVQVLSVNDVQECDKITICLKDGKINATVNNIGGDYEF